MRRDEAFSPEAEAAEPLQRRPGVESGTDASCYRRLGARLGVIIMHPHDRTLQQRPLPPRFRGHSILGAANPTPAGATAQRRPSRFSMTPFWACLPGRVAHWPREFYSWAGLEAATKGGPHLRACCSAASLGLSWWMPWRVCTCMAAPLLVETRSALLLCHPYPSIIEAYPAVIRRRVCARLAVTVQDRLPAFG